MIWHRSFCAVSLSRLEVPGPLVKCTRGLQACQAIWKFMLLCCRWKWLYFPLQLFSDSIVIFFHPGILTLRVWLFHEKKRVFNTVSLKRVYPPVQNGTVFESQIFLEVVFDRRSTLGFPQGHISMHVFSCCLVVFSVLIL